MDYRFDSLSGQFIASPNILESAPDSWLQDVQSGWHLYRHPTTDMVSICIAGQAVGWLIGRAWKENRLICTSVTASSWEEMLTWLDDLSGPFAAIVPDRIVRHDAMGQQSVVYSVQHQAVATNPLLLKEVCNGTLDSALVEQMDIPAKDHWYPFGLTPVTNVNRLLPNHFLDLSTWRSERYWPRPQDLVQPPATIEEAAAIVGRTVSNAVEALVAKYPLQIGLTAGYDSRLVVACARQHASSILAVTNVMHPVTAKIDHIVADRIARVVGMKHQVFYPRQASVDEQTDFVHQTGMSASGARYRHIALMNDLSPDRILLYGHGSEVIRGLYHIKLIRRYSSLDKVRDPEALNNVLKLPYSRKIVNAASKWLEGLPSCSDEAAVSLLYHEQRNGSWASVLRLSSKNSNRTMWAFSHRDLLNIMLRIPVEIQTESVIQHKVIKDEWPELARIPFNKLSRYREIMYNAIYKHKS